jgi:hypothetical protein
MLISAYYACWGYSLAYYGACIYLFSGTEKASNKLKSLDSCFGGYWVGGGGYFTTSVTGSSSKSRRLISYLGFSFYF